MTKLFSILIYKIITFLDIFLYLITRRSFKLNLIDYLEKDSLKKKIILGNEFTFFVPNSLVDIRLKNIFKDEPETINWINSFSNEKKIIFWDVGANIGLYSIYASQKFKNIEIVSFEPSPSNLKILTRNISLNNLKNKIKINQFPLSNKENQYLEMNESDFLYGSALNVFGEKIDFEGNEIKSKNGYKIFGTTIDFILKNNFLNCPDYLKLDVDGIEHLILSQADELFKNNNLKSILVEINENFSLQHETILNIMKTNNFRMVKKEQAPKEKLADKFRETYNYIFERIK